MRSRLFGAVCAAIMLNTPSVGFPKPPDVPVTVEITGAGIVISDPPGIDCPGTSCTASFAHSSTVTLTATPDPDGSFLTYTGDCAGTQPACELLVKKPKTVKAFFDILQSAAPAPVPKTGQTDCYDTTGNVIDCKGTGQDGEYRAGVTWPVPRFRDNGDGTVTDYLTGLIWVQDASCLIGNWSDVLDNANNLADGQCGLTDGSDAGDWRLPNVREVFSLLDFETGGLPSGSPFIGIPGDADGFYTSTTPAFNPSLPMSVNVYTEDRSEGLIVLAQGNKITGCCQRGLPVRGPE